MKLKRLLVAVAALTALPLIAQGASATGKALYAKDCMSCHATIAGGDGSTLFTRPNRHVTSLTALEQQAPTLD